MRLSLTRSTSVPFLALAACLAFPLLAQTPPTASATPVSSQTAVAPAATAPTMLSPRAAYEEAMHPLDLTRRDVGNWSDAEVAALNLAIQQAASACLLRDATQTKFEDLVDLARLCGVGQKWEITMMAAHRYISTSPEVAPSKPQLTQAYEDALEAELHLKMGSAAQQTALEMLAKVPYDGIASTAYNLAMDYLQFVDTPAAFTLGQAAEPLLLARLKVVPPKSAAGASSPTTTEAGLTPAQTYRDALRLPALEIYRDHLPQAETLASAVDAAVPAELGGDDTLLIAAEHRRYSLLGHRLPPIDVALSLDPQNAPAQELPLPGLTTALLVFPDWCAQCVRMGPQFPEGKFTVGSTPAGFYGLLATTRPTSAANTVKTGTDSTQNDPLAKLRGTPTLLVPAAALLQLEGSDYPLLILVDSKGIVRLHMPVAEDALQSGSTMDTAIAGLNGHKSVTAPTAATEAR